MKQPVHLRKMLSAARHAQQYGMKKGDFINFAAEAFCLAKSIHKHIGKLTTSANNNLNHDLAANNESTENDVSGEMKFISNELNRGGTSEPLEEDE